MKGKIICINKFIHKVLLENNTIIDTRTRGKLRNEKVSPVVGDNVIVDIKNKTIEKVEPRKNYLERPLIANIDKLLIVMSTSIPAFSSYLVDKFLLIARYNNIDNTKFIVGKVEDEIFTILENENIDAVVIDPPRKGLDKKVIDAIKKSEINKVIYVSCNPATLARDLELFNDSYNICDITLVDMFCYTNGLESVVKLIRK